MLPNSPNPFGPSFTPLPGKPLGKGKAIPLIPIGKVIRIEARQTATLSYRSSANKLSDNALTPSTSNSLDLTANPPVVLLTGSDIVQLSNGAGTIIKQAWSPVTDANGLVGTTAWNARMEIFPPFAAGSSGTDPDYIAKP
jgi:hypothetical protein